MAVDQKIEIARIASWKAIIAERDQLGALQWHLPRVAASPEEINSAETIVGFVFPDDYREFLELANGWLGFYFSVDLFGTMDFAKGRHCQFLERTEVQDFLSTLGVPAHLGVVIGGGSADLDLFILIAPSSAILPGAVLWFASEEVQRFESFSAFLSAMVNYHAQIADRLGKAT